MRISGTGDGNKYGVTYGYIELYCMTICSLCTIAWWANRRSVGTPEGGGKRALYQ
jgi:hypothetical protein